MIDPNIALSVKPVQIQDPIQAASQAMNLRALSNQVAQQNDEMQSRQTLRDLYRQNTSVDQNGMSSLNMAGISSGLAQAGYGDKIQDVQKNIMAMDAAKRQMLAQKASDLVASIAPDGSNWQDIKQQAIAMSPHPEATAAALPDKYDPKVVQQWKQGIQMNALDQKDQLEIGNKQTETQIKQQNADTSEAKLNVQKQRVGQVQQQQADNKQNQAYSHTIDLVNGGRMRSDIKQSYNDLYSSEKANNLYNMFSDPNKMNPQMFKLYTAEMGKMAQGGVPTVEELKGLNPGTLPASLAGLFQKVTNEPSPANLGEFVKQYKAYTDELSNTAKTRIYNYNKDIGDSRASLHSPSQNDTFKKSFVDKYEPTVKMVDPQGNIREVRQSQVKDAQEAGGKLYGQ